MNTAKILEICSYPPPHSGWSVRVKFVKEAIKKLGHECKVLNLGPNRKVKSPEYECVFNGLDYIYKIIKFSLKGYTVHAHMNGDSPKGFALTLAAEILNLIFGFKRCFLTFHAGTKQLYFPYEQCKALFPLFHILFLIPKKIICNSEKVKEKIIEYKINPKKIIPIPAFSKQYLNFEEVKFPPKLEAFLNKSKPVIFTNICLRKGFYLDVLIEAIKKLKLIYKNIGFLITGGGKIEDEEIISLYNILKKLKKQNIIYTVDNMNHNEFLTALKRCTIYLRTPTTDGVASSVLEALALSTPVVASENDHRPESVITYKANDVNDMVEKIIFVLNNYEIVKKNIKKPKIEDTVIKEVKLLIHNTIK